MYAVAGLVNTSTMSRPRANLANDESMAVARYRKCSRGGDATRNTRGDQRRCAFPADKTIVVVVPTSFVDTISARKK